MGGVSMNIKIVSEKTGLTKKAIKYYESEGLINPSKNNCNNYREYSDEDIVKLNLIGALRAIDIPTMEIKCLVDGAKDLQAVRKSTLDKINETISNLEKSRLIISSILSKDLQDYNLVGDQVKKLRETLELSTAEKKEFISTTLLRVFPGNYGKIIVYTYEPFLNITIDNDEKKNAWLKLVEYLDNLNEIDETHPLIRGMNNIDISKKDNQQAKDNVKYLLSGDVTTIEKYKEAVVAFVKSINENEEMRIKFKKSITQTKDLLNYTGATDDIIIDDCLEILNEDFKKNREIGKQLNKAIDEELKQEFHFTLDEFFHNLYKVIE